MEIVAAIALICGEITCGSVIYEPRFEDLASCETYLSNERLVRSSQGEQVVVDDCIWTTEEIMREFE